MAGMVESRKSDEDDADVRTLKRLYLRAHHGGASPEGLASQMARDHLALGRVRAHGEPRVGLRPLASDGDQTDGAILQIVTDDAPFLVETLIALLGSAGIAIDHIVHPILLVRRGRDGDIEMIEGEVGPAADTADGPDATPPASDGISTSGASAASEAADSWEAAESQEAETPHGARAESWIHVELTGMPAELRSDVEERVRGLLDDIGRLVDDTVGMNDIMLKLADDLDAGTGTGAASRAEAEECAELLRWMSAGNLAILGYRRYTVADTGPVAPDDGAGEQVPVPETGLGVFHSGGLADRRLRIPVADGGQATTLLTLTQGQSSTIAMHVLHPFFVAVRILDRQGRQSGEHRFLGVFTVSAMHQSVFDIPVLSRRARSVLDRSGYGLDSYNGQSVVEIIESYPRTEMFATSTAQLVRVVDEVLDLEVRRGVRLFLRGDRNGRFVSALVYLPRDRYTTTTRLAMREVLLDELEGVDVEYSARITESMLAMVHYTVQTPTAWDDGGEPDLGPDRAQRIQERLTERTRSWDDAMLDATDGSGPGRALVRRYVRAFPESYKEDFTAADAIVDVGVLRALTPGNIRVSWRRDPRGRTGQWRLMIYLAGEGISLSQVVPVLQSLGVEVIFERPYPLVRPDGMRCWIYSFAIAVVEDLRHRTDITPEGVVGQRFLETFEAVWDRRAETDRFDELVLRASIDWRDASVLRAYGKYLRQIGFAYSQNHIQDTLCANPDVVGSLVELFHARFSPDAEDGRRERMEKISGAIVGELDRIISIDTDRVLRAYLHLMAGTTRTNFFVVDSAGARHEHLSLKFRARSIPELPAPRPLHEVFVYSPRVEGVHLRFGAVARGGLRWSDRREDFRTEVLGLVKAQAVKNAVIVPLGAKGGFVVKKPPVPSGDAAADRDAHRAEGIACYQAFIAGLLDITDNLDASTGRAVAPERVVRHDGDDTYLVVAADKGTATFSDIANAMSADYDYWLADAFASGGSSGYDHKEMGITARGAWEAVRRHFRETGVDPQSDEITAVGVGDMSGDVFGNGMLCSDRIRLIAAFDHRHIFIDPDPSAAAGYAERKRLYEMPRSSWADYDPSLISEGGGVWERSRKSVPISPQVREALGLDDGVEDLSAPDLVRAVLRAPVDLLWNGGIGTYVKASTETNADAGDKANDPVRVDGRDLRVLVVGEGGNLGVTQHGRIEYARAGGKINTDAIDNSAGVDSSDREVNIKILLQHAITDGTLERADRDALLASMTDDVASMVLADNVSQNRVLGVDRRQAVQMLRVYERLIEWLEDNEALDREIEGLPDAEEIDRREEAGEGITSPELSVMLAHVKLAMKRELLSGGLPDSDVFVRRLPGYFPPALRERFAEDIIRHPLRREIIATVVTNEVVDRAGITFAFRLSELAGAKVDDAVRAFLATAEIFGLHDMWGRIDSADISAEAADQLTLVTRRLADRSSRWLLAHRPQPLAVAAEIRRFAGKVAELTPLVAQALTGAARERVEHRTERFTAAGVPGALARDLADQLDRFALLDICTTADVTDRDAIEVTRLYFALSDRLQMDDFHVAVSELERGDRWHALARLTLREDLYSAMRMLTEDVLRSGEPDEDANMMIEEWESRNGSRVERARTMLAEIADAGAVDLATLSVAARQFRSMINVSTVRTDTSR
ncbi:MAG: NAD-glutamate dehydrogenase [Tomitella sp.]|nr:NAD-glutamate dehydrogenase [Tomitella sp.]